MKQGGTVKVFSSLRKASNIFAWHEKTFFIELEMSEGGAKR